jgi:hypothetical protein
MVVGGDGTESRAEEDVERRGVRRLFILISPGVIGAATGGQGSVVTRTVRPNVAAWDSIGAVYISAVFCEQYVCLISNGDSATLRLRGA